MRWRLGVVGFPIEHSLSPQLHRAGLALTGLEGSSQRVEGRDGHSSNLRQFMIDRFDALSVTMPLKAAAAQVCDSLDVVASRTGVVNSLLTRGGQILGANTDGQGFLNAVEAEFSFSFAERRVAMLGAGGAAHAIVDALVHAGVESVTVLGRSLANVDSLTGRYENVHDHFDQTGHVDLVVNATPASSRELPGEVLRGVGKATLAVDIAYEPPMTPWRSLYQDAGCRTTNGLGMLAYQAALQMMWWWDCSIDGAELLRAIQ
jgi:shikimate dehydrogenase